MYIQGRLSRAGTILGPVPPWEGSAARLHTAYPVRSAEESGLASFVGHDELESSSLEKVSLWIER
jgi:hypothetical protein